jgi:hypothetical protein
MEFAMREGEVEWVLPGASVDQVDELYNMAKV